jgi:hypothetical protein
MNYVAHLSFQELYDSLRTIKNIYQVTNICQKNHHDTQTNQSVDNTNQLVINRRWRNIAISKTISFYIDLRNHLRFDHLVACVCWWGVI